MGEENEKVTGDYPSNEELINELQQYFNRHDSYDSTIHTKICVYQYILNKVFKISLRDMAREMGTTKEKVGDFVHQGEEMFWNCGLLFEVLIQCRRAGVLIH